MAAVYTGDGGWLDRPCVDAARGAAVSGTAVATTSVGVRTREQGRERRVAVSGRGVGVPAQLAVRTSPGVQGPLGGHASPLV